jgi:elongation factor G
MRNPSFARLPYRAVSGLTSTARFQSQNFLRLRCASTAALRPSGVAPAYQSVMRQWEQRRNASASASAV